MRETYEEAITQIFKDEGGYTDGIHPYDPGGPTNWGITIHDARQFWKADAQPEDVRNMPRSVAEDIYFLHYARSVAYDDLPPGVDYSVLDYAINSGVFKSIKTLQEIVGAKVDGIIGPNTLEMASKKNPKEIIEEIWSKRLAYDHSLTHLWPTYGHGWTKRIINGRKLALSLYAQFTNVN